MIKNKIILTFLALLLTYNNCYAITLEELSNPLPPTNRLGIGDIPEKTFAVKSSKKIETKESKFDKNSEEIKKITYADLSLKKNCERN